MKIKLPNPKDYDKDIMGFIDQLELCVHHLRKSAEKMIEKYKHGQVIESDWQEKLYLVFRHPDINYDEYFKISDNQLDQEIEIEINNID